MAGKELRHTQHCQGVIRKSPNGCSLPDLKDCLVPWISVAQACPYVRLLLFLCYFSRLTTDKQVTFQKSAFQSTSKNETAKMLLLLTVLLPGEL